MSPRPPRTIAVGDRLESLCFGPVTRAVLARYAGASGDHNPVHIDSDFARSAGQPDVFAHGMLSFGVLAQLVTRWCGPDRLCNFSARFVSITQVHDSITCHSEIIERFEQDGEARLRVAVTATVCDGRQTLVGEAIVDAS